MNESDGYIDNIFLGRLTGDRDETALRTRLRWQASDALTADFTYTRVEIDTATTTSASNRIAIRA